MTNEIVTVQLGGPNGDKVLTELRAIQRRCHVSLSEAIALCVGFAIPAMTDAGLIGGRESTPMSRAEILRGMADMIAAAEEHET